ncbi:MAG: hypothetical protein C5B53_07490 [Candidatus Melainabacteria bacterium]|nr:MAG: hypothetical protein C5B53_07490 [Candidatus Melainabacteria bacterium]
MVKALWLKLSILFVTCASAAWADNVDTYAGLEFFGSTRINRAALERLINLRSDANAQRIEAAAARLQNHFEHDHVSANIEVVSVGADQLALVVDVPDPLSSIVTRRLNRPHRVRVTSEKPFLILADLHSRLDQLEQDGRPAREEWRDGYKFYSDEAANQMIEAIQQFLPSMRNELLDTVDCDPDPVRRAQSIELLEWAAEPNDTAMNMLAAFDDVDLHVRAECAKYFYARLDQLAEDFPYDALVQGLSRMLSRPTHQDRSKSLYCLLKLCQLHTQVVPLAKSLCERKVGDLSKQSILPTIKQPADKLLAIFATAPRYATPQDQPNQNQDSSF